MNPPARLAAGAAAALCLGAGGTGSLLDSARLDEPQQHHKLTRKLTEISGLAETSDGRILAHEDQHGVVYELDPETGAVVKAFALGRKLRGDFEGIAVANEQVFLVTSSGKLVRGPEGADGEQVDYEAFDSGVSEHCREIEGLAWEPVEQLLILACKVPRDEADGVLLFRWSLEQEALVEPVWLELAAEQLAPPGAGQRFQPSGLARDPRSGHLLLLSAATRSLAELASDRSVLSVRALPKKRHRQPEGLVVSHSALWIADEGAGKRARLSAYALEPGSHP